MMNPFCRQVARTVVTLLAIVLSAHCASSQDPMQQDLMQRAIRLLRIPGPLEVSPSTSWIDGPLDANGLINYHDKVNEVLGQGVNSHENAVPLFYEAFGSLEQPPEFWERLGRPSPGPVGIYLPWKFHKEEDGAVFEPGAEFLAPWKPLDSDKTRLLAKWLDENAKSLDLLTAASRKKEYFSPFVNGKDGPLCFVLLPAVSRLREAIDSFCWRAMMRANASPTMAWQDLVTALRLARMMGRGCYVDAIVSLRQEIRVLNCQLALLQCVQPNSRLLDYLRKRMGTVPERGDLSEVFDCERMCALDTCQRIYSQDILASTVRTTDWLGDLLLPLADWNEVRRSLNQHFDNLVEWSKMKSLAAQSTRLEEIAKNQDAAVQRISGFTLGSIVLKGRSAITQYAKDSWANDGLYLSKLHQLLIDRQKAQGLVELSLLILEKRASRGNWPESIDDLKATSDFEKQVDSSFRELFEYELNATHAVLRIDDFLVQFQRY